MYSCAICSGDTFRPIWVAQRYIGDAEPPAICQNCGFVQVNNRRSSSEIAADWSRLYAEKIYDPTWPGVKARLFYVAEWIDQNMQFSGKQLLDIGGGNGMFAVFAEQYGGAHATVLEPTGSLWDQTIETTIEGLSTAKKFDIVTILWTLENCGDANAMIAKARECLKPDGHLIVATGSRILVPFRKPMSAYFSTEPQDLHAFRWSVESLRSILMKHRFDGVWFNDYHQNDVLLAYAHPADKIRGLPKGNDPAAVENHFIDWYRSFP